MHGVGLQRYEVLVFAGHGHNTERCHGMMEGLRST